MNEINNESGLIESKNLDSTSLDVLGNNRNTYCGRYSLRNEPDQDGGNYRYLKLYCKTWNCSYCAPKKANRVRHAIADAALKHGLNKLLTLTLDPSKCEADESAVYIKKCWNKLRVYLDRLAKAENSPPLDFIQVLEFQKSGYAHLHILINKYISHDWIKKAWEKLGGGRIVDIRYVDMHRIPSYLSKYLTKQTLLSVKGKLRRYTTSRRVKLFVKRVSQGVWQLVKQALWALRMAAGRHAFDEIKDQSGELKEFSLDYFLSELDFDSR